jgi:hypothetical protein
VHLRQHRPNGEKMKSSSADVCTADDPILIGVSKIRRCRCGCDEGVTIDFRFLIVDDDMVVVLPFVVVVVAKYCSSSRVVMVLVVVVTNENDNARKQQQQGNALQ